MDETIAELGIVLKAAGLNEQKDAIAQLRQVLDSAGISYSKFAKFVNESSAGQQKANTLDLQAINLKRQLETAEQAHMRRMENYRELLRAGRIEKELFNKAEEASLRAMRAQSAMGGKGGGLAAMQIGYGVQDFATVAAMGGEGALARGFMAASNNLGQMIVVMGIMNPMMTALVATGLTLAAVLGPHLWNAVTGGVDKTKEAADRLKASLDSIARSSESARNRMESVFRLQDLSGMGSSQLEQQTRSLSRSLQMQETARDEAAMAVREILRPIGEQVTSRLMSEAERIYLASEGLVTLEEATAVQLARYEEELKKTIAASSDHTEAERKLEEETKKFETIRTELAFAEQKLKEAREKEAAEALRAAELQRAMSAVDVGLQANRNVGTMLQAAQRAAAVASGAAGSAQFSLGDQMQQFAANLMNDPNLDPQSRREMMELFTQAQVAQIAMPDANKPKGAAPAFSGVREFGNQFQLALLQADDKSAKDRQKQIELAQKMVEYLQGLSKELVGKFAVVGP